MAAERPVAIVPARGGSKRIPRKNIRSFRGRPLIAWTLDTLQSSGLFGRVVVSTDDEEIAEVATASGAWVPFRRPEHLADDHTATAPVIAHAVTAIEALLGASIGDVCVAYPAAAFVTPDHLRSGYREFLDRDVDVLFTATSFAAPIWRAWQERPDGLAEMIWPEHRLARSQDLPEAFHDAGQFYWSKRSRWFRDPSSPERAAMFLLSRTAVVDIDTEEDWIVAERIHRQLFP